MKRRRTIGTLAFVALLAARSAHAGDPTLAESLFREGKALMEAKNFAAACPKLDESFRQDPATGTLLALAMCQEEAGKFASAWTTYHSVVGRAEREGRKDRADAARRRATALEPRLSYLTVEVPSEVAALPGLVVRRDGVPLPAAAWGSATPADPGKYLVDASAENRAPFSETVALGAEASRKIVRIPVLAPSAPSKPAVTAGAAAAASPAAPAPRDEPRAVREPSASPLPLVGIVLGGAGVVALGVGAGFALRAKNLDEESRSTGGCNPDTGFCETNTGLEANRDARAAGNVATALFIGGGALVAGGVALYLVGSASDASSASLSVSPLVGLRGFGIGARGAF